MGPGILRAAVGNRPPRNGRGWIVRSPVLDAGGGLGWGDLRRGELVCGEQPQSGRRISARAITLAWAYKASSTPRFDAGLSPAEGLQWLGTAGARS